MGQPERDTGRRGNDSKIGGDDVRLNALWWWIDRWRKSTAYTDMTLEEQGAYRNLLDEAQLRGGPLPTDERILARACGDAKAWKRVRPQVMKHFRITDAGWRNETLDEVLKASIKLASKQRRYRARQRSPDGNKQGNDTGNADGNAVVDKVVTNAVSPSPSPGTSLPKNGSEGGTPAPARATSIGVGLLKPHGNVAFDSPRVYVKWKQHFDFVGFRNNPNAEQELQAFYQRVSEAWNTGAHAADSPGADMFAFWRDRYNEEWPAAPIAEPKPSRLPKWAQS